MKKHLTNTFLLDKNDIQNMKDRIDNMTSSESSFNGAITGSLPINSGMKPYFIKSSGETCENK